MVYDRRWVSHRNEAEAFDGFIKIDNIEKNKNLYLNKGMTIRKPFIIYVTEKKNNNRRNNAKSVRTRNGVITLKKHNIANNAFPNGILRKIKALHNAFSSSFIESFGR